jgi:hypothetical protein
MNVAARYEVVLAKETSARVSRCGSFEPADCRSMSLHEIGRCCEPDGEQNQEVKYERIPMMEKRKNLQWSIGLCITCHSW